MCFWFRKCYILEIMVLHVLFALALFCLKACFNNKSDFIQPKHTTLLTTIRENNKIKLYLKHDDTIWVEEKLTKMQNLKLTSKLGEDYYHHHPNDSPKGWVWRGWKRKQTNTPIMRRLRLKMAPQLEYCLTYEIPTKKKHAKENRQ